MGKFNEEMTKAGVMLAAEGLHATSKGTRVKVSGGNRMVTDGPFTETKEVIAGFWIFRVKSKEEAIEWLKRAPFDEGTEVEIRQVFEAEDFGPALTPELRKKRSGYAPRWLRRNSAVRDMPDCEFFVSGCRFGHPPFDLLMENTQMKYILLIYADEQAWTESERQECYGESTQLAHTLKSKGQYLAANPLQSVSTATSVQVRNGERLVTDGPFAETREQLGGYFLVDRQESRRGD